MMIVQLRKVARFKLRVTEFCVLHVYRHFSDFVFFYCGVSYRRKSIMHSIYPTGLSQQNSGSQITMIRVGSGLQVAKTPT